MQVTWFSLFTQVASLFKTKAGHEETSSAQNAPSAPGQPLSYAEFVVQSKNKGLQGAEKHTSAAKNAAGQSSVKSAASETVTKTSTDLEKPETVQQGPAEVPTKEEGQSSESCVIAPHLLGSGNSIIVSPRQVCILYSMFIVIKSTKSHLFFIIKSQHEKQSKITLPQCYNINRKVLQLQVWSILPATMPQKGIVRETSAPCATHTPQTVQS